MTPISSGNLPQLGSVCAARRAKEMNWGERGDEGLEGRRNVNNGEVQTMGLPGDTGVENRREDESYHCSELGPD